MWRRLIQRLFTPAEEERLKVRAQKWREKYESEAIYDRAGNRWGRYGEEISADAF